MVLRRSIEQLEPGLTIIDGDSEQTVASARIDITTGSQQTLRWREMDPNHRSRAGAVSMRLDQVEHPTGEPDEREYSDAAGDRGFVAFIDFLEGEAEKNGEGET